MEKNKKDISWYEKYHLALKESLTIKEIMQLRSCGQPTAMELREEAVNYCLANNIPFHKTGSHRCYYALTGRDLSFYYDKMIKELEAQEIYNKAYLTMSKGGDHNACV